MTPTALSDRSTIEVHLGPDDLAEALRRDVLQGLTAERKHLPPKWFYDEVGSLLFDDITRLPEYYPTRRETEILRREAPLIAARSGAASLVELGSGTSTKTKLLLDAMATAGQLERVVPFDVCEPILRAAGPELEARYPGVRVHAVVGDFEQHLHCLPVADEPGPALVAFLGGTIGNLRPVERATFLGQLAGQLRSGDHLLLGTDLVKDPRRLVAAYDDSQGVTAAFNRNVLRVVNRELQGDLDVDRFAHVAIWDPDEQWIEMHLRSAGRQAARLAALDLDLEFTDGEHLHTEISAKFTRGRIEGELAGAGLEIVELMTDEAEDFALTLAAKP
jgi:L-histidine N-alpha-methyltransferase